MTDEHSSAPGLGVLIKNVLMFAVAALAAAFIVHLVKTRVLPKIMSQPPAEVGQKK